MKTVYAVSVSESIHFPVEQAEWQIISIHDEYVNIKTPDGLVTLIKSGSALVPFGIEVNIEESWYLCGLQKHQAVHYDLTGIVIEGSLAIKGLNDCSRYICRPCINPKFDIEEMTQRLELIYQQCLKDEKDEGILVLLGNFDPQRYRMRDKSGSGFYEERIRQRFEALLAGVHANDDYLIVEGVCGLLGVGPGLTPSGDDFLLGFFAGFSSMGLEYCRPAAQKLAQYIVQNAPNRTTLIAAEYLKYGAKGFYHQNLIQLIEAFHGGSDDELIIKGQRLKTLGNYSGIDLLTGFTYGGFTALHSEKNH